jgi:hypothetical protein
LTSNSMTAAAVQMTAATPAERVSEHSPAKTVKVQGVDQAEMEKRPIPDTPAVPAKIYNSHGEIVEPPNATLVDTEM